MGPKKKPQTQVDKQTKPPSTLSNKMRTLKTNDGASFQINDALLSKYSGKFRKRLQQFKGDQIIQMQDADKTTFKYIDQFFTIRKQKQLGQIHIPMRSNISLKYIMEESDAQLMQKIQKEGGMQLVRRLLDLTTTYQIQDMKKRLICLVALSLSQHTIDELKQMYEIQNIEANDDQLKSQMKSHLEHLKKTYHDKKMDEQ